MKYRALKPFIAFGKTPDVGEIVRLTSEQADALAEIDAIAPYQVKVERPVKERKKKKPSQSVHPVRASRKKTVKKQKRTAKK